MTFAQIRNYIKGLFNPIVDELKQDIEDANGIVPISYDDFKNLPQSEKDNGKAYFIPDVNFNSEKIIQTGFTPIGTIISVMGNHAPSHYLICDGSTYNISQYSDLADYFEQEFGSKNYFGGDGTTTFAVPDLRGEFLRGTGTNSHKNQGSGASIAGTHQDSTITPYFFRRGTSSPAIGLTGNTAGALYAANIDSSFKYGTGNAKWVVVSGSVSDPPSGSIDSITSRPTNTSVLYCIATCNIYIDAKHNYSTQETVIGEWIDGKPLYQKTVIVDLPTMSAKTNNDITVIDSTNAANMELINVFGRLVRSDGYIMIFPLSILAQADGTTTVNIRIQQIPDKSIKIQYRAYAAQSIRFTAYVTLQYTKSTD